MKASFPKKIHTRLLLLVLLPLLPAVLLVLHTNLEQRRLGTMQVKENALRTAQLAAATQSAVLANARQLIETLAGSPYFLGTNAPVLSYQLGTLLKLHPYYVDYGLLETNGDLVASGRYHGPKLSLAKEPFFQDVSRRRAFIIGDYHPAPGTNSWPCLPLAHPMFDQSGQMTRIMYAAINLKALEEKAAQVPLPAGATLTVLDSHGTVLARQPEPDKWAGHPEPRAKALLAALNAGTNVVELADSQDTPHLFALAPVEHGRADGLLVCVGIPKISAYADANEILFRNLVLLGLILVLTLLAARLFAEQIILRPVDSLLRASKQITTGDFSARTGITPGASQLDQLAGAFDEMAATLQRRESELRQAENKFRILVEQSIVGIYIIQGDRFTYVNPRLAEIVDYPASEITNRPVLDFIAPQDRNTVSENIRIRLQGTVPSIRYQLKLQRRDGSEVSVEVHGARTEYDGQPAIIGTLLDITDRQRAEAEVRRLNAELEQRVLDRTNQLAAVNKELESFSYSVSHDLRAPLRHINGFVEILKEETRDKLPDRSRKHLNFIADASKRMGQLIDDLLVFSRMSRAEMRQQSVNFQHLATEVIDDLQPETKDRNIIWKRGELPEVQGDPGLLKQVWANLIGNSLKYTRPRDPAVIEIGCSTGEDNEPVFFIRDNGVGFDMKYSNKLFGVFERLHRAEEFEGTGIGLANVQRILLRHGGRIWAEAAVDRGATFYFTVGASKKNGVPASDLKSS